MPTIRYTGGGRYRVAGTTFEPGDVVAVDDDVAAYLAEDVDGFEPADAPAEVPHVSSDDIAALLDGTVADVEAALATGEYDTVLDRIAEAEADGDDRVGVRDAVEARQDGLTDHSE